MFLAEGLDASRTVFLLHLYDGTLDDAVSTWESLIDDESFFDSILEPVVSQGSIVQIDPTRNLLMLAGPGREMQTWLSLIDTFDVDWLEGMSFGLFPLDFERAAGGESSANQYGISQGDRREAANPGRIRAGP